MESRAKILGHPIHPMLIPFPFGLLATAVIFDILYLVWGNPALANASYWMIIAGVVGGLLAAPFGLIDWLAIPQGTRAKSVGLLHGAGNVVVLLLFAASWWLRRGAPGAGDAGAYVPSAFALVLSFAGCLPAAVAAWLGGELVDRLGVGVDDGAHLDAPNSLSGSPASESAPRAR